MERHVIEVIERWLDGFGELDAGIDENGACPSVRHEREPTRHPMQSDA